MKYILALDLEHTLISSAVTCFVRPNLNEFLSWAVDRFEVMLFTTVPEEVVSDIQGKLYQMGDVSETFRDLKCVDWPRTGSKDLTYICSDWHRVIMVDDIPDTYAVKEQLSQWIEIKPFDLKSTDTELQSIRDLIIKKLQSGLVKH